MVVTLLMRDDEVMGFVREQAKRDSSWGRMRQEEEQGGLYSKSHLGLEAGEECLEAGDERVPQPAAAHGMRARGAMAPWGWERCPGLTPARQVTRQRAFSILIHRVRGGDAVPCSSEMGMWREWEAPRGGT